MHEHLRATGIFKEDLLYYHSFDFQSDPPLPKPGVIFNKWEDYLAIAATEAPVQVERKNYTDKQLFYTRILQHRCFFITEQGRCGLGPCNMDQDDKVVVLREGICALYYESLPDLRTRS